MTAFTYAVLEIANEEGSTVSLEAIRNKAFAKLQSGEAKTLITSSLNGKSFSYLISKPADALFTEVTQTIRGKWGKGGQLLTIDKSETLA